jgi:GNAT superfamily N-acetyltransferase
MVLRFSSVSSVSSVVRNAFNVVHAPGTGYQALSTSPLMTTMSIRVERFSGKGLERHVDALAQLRIEVFRDFPYLYDGSLDYERKYIATYLGVPDSVIAIAFDGDRVVGASTGLPMADETDDVKRPFLDNGYNPDRIFYFGESVLKKGYRGNGLGVRFFEEREAHAASSGRFDWTCFCAVQRPADHPARPADYVPLDAFWKKRGYSPHPELTTTFSWKDIGDAGETGKPMMFWMKRL